MRNRALHEAVVINNNVVARYAASAAEDIRNPEVKKWLVGRLRNLILNSEDLLVPYHETLPHDAPDYMLQAVKAGQTIYQFTPAIETRLAARIQHIKDFISSLTDTAASEPTNAAAQERKALATKILSKIERITIPQFEDMHTKWMSTGMKQAASMDKQGCDVVLTFNDGMYWVKYTDPNTMKRDGADLQNCLANGNYWGEVKSGAQSVYGLRKPTDEAVVGVRVINAGHSDYGYHDRNGGINSPRILECKGKQNGHALPEYIPHIMKLLGLLGVKNDSADLNNAGIHVNGGNYGTFEDIADVLLDEDGVKVMHVDKSGANTLVRVGRFQFWARADVPARKILDVSGYDAIPLQAFKKGLNALNYSVSTDVVVKLAKIGMVANDKGFGTIDEVGSLVWQGEGEDRALTALRDGTGYFYFFIGGQKGSFQVSNGLIHRLNRIDENTFEKIIPALNAAKIRVDLPVEINEIWTMGYISTSEGYKRITDKSVSQVVYTKGASELRQLTAKTPIRGTIYILGGPKAVSPANIVISRGILKQHGGNGGSQENLWHGLQTIVEREKVTKIEGWGSTERTGIYKDPSDGRLRASLTRFLEIVESNPAYKVEDGLMDHNSLFALLTAGFSKNRANDGEGELSERAQAAIAKAFRPTAATLVEIADTDHLPTVGLTVKKITPCVFPKVLRMLPKYKSMADTYDKRIMKTISKQLKPDALYVYKADRYSATRGMIDSSNMHIQRAALNKLSEIPPDDKTNLEDVFGTLNTLYKVSGR